MTQTGLFFMTADSPGEARQTHNRNRPNACAQESLILNVWQGENVRERRDSGLYIKN
jgi:hypothetical protein